MDRVRVIELEVDILDDKRPHFVTESVGIEMSLNRKEFSITGYHRVTTAVATHLERQPSLNLIRQDLRDRFIKVRENLHSKLGLDATLGDQVV
jgi:hypothetical protein